MLEELADVLIHIRQLPESFQRRATRMLLSLLEEWEDRSTMPEMSDREYNKLCTDRARQRADLSFKQFEDMIVRLRRKAEKD